MGRALAATLAGGLVAGALDIAYACAHYAIALGIPPQRILQSVAAGWVGIDAAVAGGWGAAALGLGSHFFIAIGMAGAFVIASRVMPALLRHALFAGVLYGLFLYAAMQYVVLPLSNAPGNPPQGQFLIGSISAHTLLVGVPIALIARAFAPRPAT